MYISTMSAYVCMYYVSTWCLQRLKGGMESPKTKVTDWCQLSRGCRELNQYSLPEHLSRFNVFLIYLSADE